MMFTNTLIFHFAFLPSIFVSPFFWFQVTRCRLSHHLPGSLTVLSCKRHFSFSLLLYYSVKVQLPVLLWWWWWSRSLASEQTQSLFIGDRNESFLYTQHRRLLMLKQLYLFNAWLPIGTKQKSGNATPLMRRRRRRVMI